MRFDCIIKMKGGVGGVDTACGPHDTDIISFSTMITEDTCQSPEPRADKRKTA